VSFKPGGLMKHLILILLMPFSVSAKINCNNLEKYKMALAVHGSNWLNANTTRTSTGGPYLVKKLECHGNCQIVQDKKTYVKYIPKHPDANAEGYVEYPEISKLKEHAAVTTFARALQATALYCKKKVTIADNDNSFVVDYKSGPIKSDIFNFDSRSMLVSWVREEKQGKTHIINF
jgi:flagellar basal-body rod protein FlgC